MIRKKAFGIFGGFLAVMLVFTIISRAVSGAAMARVETVKISTGTIEHKVSGSGKVEAGKEVAVYTESGQRVKEICVQEGQSVEKGDTLFLLDMEQLEEQILAAQQELEKIKLQDQDAQSNRDAQQESRALAKKRAAEDYNQAVSQGDAEVAKAKAAWDAAEGALQEFLRNTPRPGGNVGAANVGGNIQTAKLEKNAGAINTVENMQAVKWAKDAEKGAGGKSILENQKGKEGFSGIQDQGNPDQRNQGQRDPEWENQGEEKQSQDGQESGKQEENAQNPRKQSEDAQSLENLGKSAQNPENPGKSAQNPRKQSEDAQSPGKKGENAQNPGKQGENDQELGKQGEDAQNPGKQSEDAQNPGKQEEDAQNPGKQSEDAQNSEKQGESDQNPGKQGENDQNPENQGQGDPGQSDGAAEWDAQRSQLEQAVAEAKSAYEAAVSSRTDSIKAAARAVEDASASVPSDSTAAQNEIAKKQQELALGKLQDLQAAEGKVIAPVNGMVTQIAVTTGDFTTEGTAMRLADTSQGNRLVATVDKSDEDYVQKGSQATISPSGTKDKIEGFVVSNVSVNKEDNTLLDVAIDLPHGVLEPGSSAQIEIVQKSSQFSSVIPIQALHEEQSGYYVLILREQQGVMGAELVAERMDVQVLDKNRTNAALEEGLLTGDQEINSAASRSVEDGSRVRKEE